MANEPEIMKVSVLMMTYNHEEFIREAIEGVINQETDFQYELVIGVDLSKDNTAAICQEFAQFHDHIKVLCSSERLGMRSNFFRTLQECQGEYIALCEGDDIWTNEEKLQQQSTFLDKSNDCNGVFHDAKSINQYGETVDLNYFPTDKLEFDFRDVLLKFQSKEATCSLMFRRSLLFSPPEWFLRKPIDFFLDLVITRDGLLCRIPKNMSAYRIHVGGIWQGRNSIHHLKEDISRYELLLEDLMIKNEFEQQLHMLIANKYLCIARDKSVSFFKMMYFSARYLDYTSYSSLKAWKTLVKDILFYRLIKNNSVNS